jgi:hypothetical protein
MTILRLMLTMTLPNWSRKAERNGYVLDRTLDQEKNDFEYFCNKMTRQEWEQYLEWEKEE